MYYPEPYLPADVVPREAIAEWKERNRAAQPKHDCPEPVARFIDALANKLGDFERQNVFRDVVMGYFLYLANVANVDRYSGYTIEVPVLVAVDHRSNMHRAWRRRGKQGLIDYVKAHAKGEDQQLLMDVMNVHVFGQHSEDYNRVLSQIAHGQSI